MKKYIYFTALFAIFFISLGTLTNDCNKDITDPRGKIKPWEKGAWETGTYRNVFLEAGYKKKI